MAEMVAVEAMCRGADPNLNTLVDYRYSAATKPTREHGMGSDMFGAAG